jgi:hypothetical protein
MRAGIRMKMRVPTMEHVINNTLFIAQKNDLLDVVRWQQGMNKEFLHSDLVDQDVLLLGGEKDAFQPPVLFYKQWKALTNAKSITGRVFTEAEQAANHCGMGNLGLVVQAMLNWMDEKNLEIMRPQNRRDAVPVSSPMAQPDSMKSPTDDNEPT